MDATLVALQLYLEVQNAKFAIYKNFRSLQDFHVARLGAVNLVVDKNNSGKSSVLEAIRIFAGNAQRNLLEDIGREHDEKIRMIDGEDESIESNFPFEDFFSGRRFSSDEERKIVIGDTSSADDFLTIEHVHLLEYQENLKDESDATRTVTRRRPIAKDALSTVTDETIRQALIITKGTKTSTILLDAPRRVYVAEIQEPAKCSLVPTRFVPMDEIARDWDKIVFTEYEGMVKDALRYIARDLEGLVFVESEDVLFLRSEQVARRPNRRIPKVKMMGDTRAFPLNSLGDGVLRVLQLVLKVFPASGGYLLIDEFENGLHYSVQDQLWGLIFDLAAKLRIQVFATTHSWDCIQSFARVAETKRSIEGVLFRVGQSARTSNHGQVIATVFDEAQLYSITQADLEVRG